ncbi:MAG TPA: acetone carboxylase subunit gamma, partial [Halobacteriales archaeon]|nr:acetone carboxylase subunit gamma [Halobacteriales archaeon]
ICDADENYKEHCAMETKPLEEIAPGFESPSALLGADHDVEFRQFYCPSCAVLVEHEIARAADPILQDIEIDPSSVS